MPVAELDAAKQAVAKYLGLSEGAIDTVCRLQKLRFEQSLANDFKLPAPPLAPLPGMLGKWSEKVDLFLLISDILQMIYSTVLAQFSV